jgi:predicted dehydrogenase
VGLRLGLLSTARINSAIVGGAAKARDVEVVAVASRDLAKAQAQADELGIPRAVEGYEALLADDEVDCVYVSLPNGMHVDWSIRALEAGKHVLCEKPLSRRAHDVERAFDAADRADRILMEAFMWRHHPQTLRLSKMLAEGAIGRVTGAHARFGFLLDHVGDIRLAGDLDGGALMDVGCYCVSGLRLVAGEPERVSAEQITGDGGVDISLSAVLRLPGDVLGTLECSFAAPLGHALEVTGDGGRIVLNDPWHGRAPVLELQTGDGEERIEIEAANPYAHQLENMAHAVAGEERPRLGRDDALGQARTIEALYAAADGGGPVAP